MRKRILLLSAMMGVCVMSTGCMKASKQEIVESTYYQKLQDENDKLEKQLKDSKKSIKELNNKIKTIHEYTGDQKLASYKKKVAASNIYKVDMIRINKERKYQGFAVTNVPVCNYVKSMVADAYRVIGLTVSDVQKKYESDAYSYALIDEDNTTYEFKVYGNSYIVFDDIPENVYCFDHASVIGEGLIDAKTVTDYSNWTDKIADAAFVVSDKKIKFTDTIDQACKYFNKIKKNEDKKSTYKTTGWDEYRFYTAGSVTKVRMGTEKVVCVEDNKGKISYYTISANNLKKLKKCLQ